MTDQLAPHHRKILEEESAISPEIWQARGVFSILDPNQGKNQLRQLGFSLNQVGLRGSKTGLILPVHGTDASNGIYVFRPDNPYSEDQKRKGKLPDGAYPQKVHKYIWPKGVEPRIDCPPICQAMLKNPDVPLWVTEGQKKGDSLASQGLCVIDFPNGVWGWKSKLSGVLSDFDLIVWQGRTVYLVFDSDVASKKNVRLAMERLSKHLANWGAKVIIVPLPDVGQEKTGVDDFFAHGGTLAELQRFADIGSTFKLQTTNQHPAENSAEYIKILTELGYTFTMNSLTDRVMVNGQYLTDPLEAEIRTKLRDAGYTKVNIIKDAYITQAYHRQCNPIKDTLNSLKWDGRNHIVELAKHFTDDHAEHYQNIISNDGNYAGHETFYLFLKRWLIGTVAKVFKEEQNVVFVLDGAQDIGKSYFARWLGSILENHYIEGPLNPDNKDHHIRAISNFLWEVGELGSTTRKADREALKDILTRKRVEVRLPYAKHPIEKPVTVSFIGTINNENGFLSDPTGNRRFLSCKLMAIDWSYCKNVDVTQVWAEAVDHFKQGQPSRLTPPEKKLQQAINDDYMIVTPAAAYFDRYFEVGQEDKFYTTIDILSFLEANGLKGSQNLNAQHLASHLLKLGVKKGRKKVNGVKVSGYFGISKLRF